MLSEIKLDNTNIGKANPHDGTRGSWTIIPAEGKLLVKDEVSNRVYEINMTEITPYNFINKGGNVNLNLEEES
tara:strand:+ start:138 stop:356 length:219 start_codon:yes stop_codon:yes gene_type:complete